MQAEVGLGFISIFSEPGAWEGWRQHIPHPCQALSAKSTWPGPRTAPPELCRETGAGEETGGQGLARNVAGGLCSQVKCH